MLSGEKKEIIIWLDHGQTAYIVFVEGHTDLEQERKKQKCCQFKNKVVVERSKLELRNT
jgi:hypothetical protein